MFGEKKLLRTLGRALLNVVALTTIELEYVIRGYHEYKRVWSPEINERLSTEIKTANPRDRYGVRAVVSEEHGTV